MVNKACDFDIKEGMTLDFDTGDRCSHPISYQQSMLYLFNHRHNHSLNTKSFFFFWPKFNKTFNVKVAGLTTNVDTFRKGYVTVTRDFLTA